MLLLRYSVRKFRHTFSIQKRNRRLNGQIYQIAQIDSKTSNPSIKLFYSRLSKLSRLRFLTFSTLAQPNSPSSKTRTPQKQRRSYRQVTVGCNDELNLNYSERRSRVRCEWTWLIARLSHELACERERHGDLAGLNEWRGGEEGGERERKSASRKFGFRRAHFNRRTHPWWSSANKKSICSRIRIRASSFSLLQNFLTPLRPNFRPRFFFFFLLFFFSRKQKGNDAKARTWTFIEDRRRRIGD